MTVRYSLTDSRGLRMGESLNDFPLPLGVHLSGRTPFGMKRQAMRVGSLASDFP